MPSPSDYQSKTWTSSSIMFRRISSLLTTSTMVLVFARFCLNSGLSPRTLDFNGIWEVPDLCLSQKPQMRLKNVSRALECAFACLNVANCLRFQFYKGTNICDIFITWQLGNFLKNSVSGCRMFQRKGMAYVFVLCTLYFVLCFQGLSMM